jgi:outer membrane protein assembly factor BamB
MRVFWQDVEGTYSPDGPPLTGPLLFDDPDARTGWSFAGLAADETRGIFFAVDQARGLANAFRPTDDGNIDLLWQRELRVSASNTLVADRGLVYLTDFVDGANHLVALDLLTGEERVRLRTPSTRATIGALLCTEADEVWMASNEPGQPTGHLVRVRVRD